MNNFANPTRAARAPVPGRMQAPTQGDEEKKVVVVVIVAGIHKEAAKQVRPGPTVHELELGCASPKAKPGV